LVGKALPPEGLLSTEIDAIYFMVSSIFGFEVSDVRCVLCGYPHLDKDWFSIHPHKRHLCAGCGKNFRDSRIGIGNPVRYMQLASGIVPRAPKKSSKTLVLDQRDFPGGIQIWGSNSAIIWSAKADEEEGIHVHAFRREAEKPALDDTFSQVTINGVDLDPVMVRTLMAQNALPHLEGRITTLDCTRCGDAQFDAGTDAFTPATDRSCSKCGGDLRGPGRLRKIISNPLVVTLDRLASSAHQPRQQHKLGLLPETL
jgi:hypothetical protein